MLIIDTETTGVSPSDRIIELAILSGDTVHCWRFNPGMPIPAEATAVHGITDADVADCASFADQAADVLSHINGDDTIEGFNLRFDLSMLQSELDRASLPLLDLTRFKLIDPMRLWQAKEPRTLAAAVEKFLGRPHDTAHSASGDVKATRDVLAAMLRIWPEGIEHADPLPDRASWCGPTDDLVWRDGLVVLNFGKHKGTPIHELDAGMLKWLVENARAKHVRATAQLAMTPEKFLERIKNRRAA